MKVILRYRNAPDGSNYWSLTPGREYEIIGIEADDYRLIDDTGEPILFDPACFEITDPQEPGFWRSVTDEEGERCAYPPGWGVPGFFEAWHDRDKIIRQVFAEQLAYWYPGVGAPA